MEITELVLLEDKLTLMHENFTNGLVFDDLVEVRNTSIGDNDKFLVNEKVFRLPSNTVSIDVTEVIKNKDSLDKKANKLFMSLVSYIRKEINKLIVNHNMQSTLKGFENTIKLLLSGEVIIDKKEDSYILSTQVGCGIIY